jgi:hypothetical protein
MCGAGMRLGQLECRVPTPSAIAFVSRRREADERNGDQT